MADRSASGTFHRTMVAALLPVLALAVASCGSGRSGTDPGAGDPSAILAAWRSFPVDASPRPLVLTGPTVLDPDGGFPGDKDKEAYLTGRFELAARLPATPTTAGGYPVISAKAAFDRLRSVYPDTTIKGGRTLPTLRIVAAALSQAYFDTDRGRRRLPAWRLGLDRFAAPVWVLAVDSKALWTGKPTSATNLDFRATPDPDGRTLSLSFIGGPDEPTPCGISYTASAVESATAVLIRLDSKPRQSAKDQPRQSGEAVLACPAMGYPRTVSLALAAPLAGRVLLTPYGVPLPVPAS